MKLLSFTFLKEFKRDYPAAFIKLINENGEAFKLKTPFYDMHIFVDTKYLAHVLYSNGANYGRTLNVIGKYLHDPSMSSVETNTFWLNLRATSFNTPMTETSVKKYIEVLVENTTTQLNSWESLADQQKPVAIYKRFEMLALSNLSKTVLGGAPIDNNHVLEIVDEVMSLVFASESSFTNLPWILPTPTKRRTQYVVKELLNICEDVLRYCFSNDSTDFHLLIEVKKKYGTLYLNNQLDENAKITLRGHVAAFILAGFDTITRSLMLMFSYLSKFPIIASNVSKEFQEKIGKNGITTENIDLLSYSRATVLEMLRYSGGIFPIIPRRALNNDQIGNYSIKKNDLIVIPANYLMNMDKYWENPGGFDPERFLKPLDESYRFVFLPFGTGSHGCPGRNFALVQLTIVLSMVIQRYRLALAPFQEIDTNHPARIKMFIDKLSK